MLKGENAKKPLNLNQGFTWIAVVEVGKQNAIGRKVLWQIAGATGWPRITIGLDTEDNLRVWLSDSSGIQHVSEPLPGEEFLGKLSLIIVSVAPEPELVSPVAPDNSSRLIQLESAGGSIVTSKMPIPSVSALEKFSIGANLEGAENTGFLLGRLTIFEGLLNDSDKIEIVESLRKEYNI